ncbi:hypothetical protein Hanom_Chr10g00944791 [Helianthus anomalus]
MGLKQKDTFMELAPCRDWYLNSFPPGEVNRQRAQTHDGLYHAYVVGEANTRAANHQIVREWRTMCRERGDGRSTLRAAEEILSKERDEWKEVCKKDNQCMYVARSKITDLEAQIATLTKKVEDVKADIERVASKDKDLHTKDVEIKELKRRMHEQTDKNESLEIDLEAERVKVATAEEAKQRADEARDISATAFNVAQNNYSEVQSIVDTLVFESEWMRNRGVALIANSILNASKMDAAVVMLIDASRAVGHRGGYLECAHHVEEAFGHEFNISHCSVTDQADAALAHAEGVYDHLSLPVIDLVTEALKHNDWCSRVKTILDPPQTMELSDE